MVGRLFGRVVLVSACLVLIAVLGAIVLGSSQQVFGASQVSTTVGVDADPTGNEAASLGQIDACISVGVGQTFDVDIFVTDVADLAGWQATFGYEPSVLQVVGTNVNLFLAGAQAGRVLDLSEVLPDQDGSYGFRVADMTPGAAGHDGSGVLARVTLEALAAGSSFLTLDEIILGSSEILAIGDVTGDSIFDGPISYAQVWVGEPCPSALPTPPPKPSPTVIAEPTSPGVSTPIPPEGGETPQPTSAAPGGEVSPSEEGGSDGVPWAIVLGAAAGAVVVALALGFAAGRLLQRG
jgi:hypothetical protein